MSYLSTRHLEKLLEATAIIHEHAARESFPERLFRALSLVFEGTCHSFELFSKDGTHWGETNVPVAREDLPSFLDRIAELAPTQNPVFGQVAKGVRTPLRLSDLISRQQFTRSDFYHDIFDIFNPIDLNHQIAIPLYTESSMGGITINSGTTDFTTDDLELAKLLTPHICLAFESERLFKRLREGRQSQTMLDFTKLKRLGFTRREVETSCWLVEGKRDKEIAIILNLSPRTIQHFVAAILRKLKVETRTSAVAELLNLGITPSK